MDTINNFKREYTIEDLETLLDTISEEVWLKNKNGNIIYANKAYCAKNGLSKMDILNRMESDFKETERSQKCFQEDQGVLKNDTVKSSDFVYKKNTLNNIKHNIKSLLNNTARLFANNTSKSDYNYRYDFFTNVSHELKTPINIILATTQLILKSIENKNDFTLDDIKRYMNIIKQNSFRLLRLVNNILDSAKINDGYYTINLSNHNIVSIIEDIVMSTADYIKGKNKNIIFDTDEEEIILACDPDKIERIVLNLLSNALKYTDDNGNIEVILKKDCKNNNLLVHVKNDGAPISNEDCHRIFNRFIQSNKSEYKEYEGSGIGLSLSKSLVELHGGNIWATPDLEKGAEFIFSLPIRHISKNDICCTSPQSINSKIEKCIVEFSDIYSIC